MNTAADVDRLVEQIRQEGTSVSDMVVRVAEACMEWPYVYAEKGAEDTPEKRRSRANSLDSSMPAEAAEIRKTCPVLSKKQEKCGGCRWYPGGQRVRCFDCRGFTWWVLQQAGISIEGGGCTSQWKNDANWTVKGPISEMPDVVCVLFWQDKKDKNKMAHTGLHIGGGQIIHCSGEVKRDTTATKGWTHYAIPVGMDGDVPVQKPTLRRGSTGPYVVECQEDLIKCGYDVGKSGADGKFGANTELAVKQFQGDHQLKPDGIVGPMTYDALNKAVEPEPKTVLYTVHIPHLTEYQADALLMNYSGSWKTAEGSGNT